MLPAGASSRPISAAFDGRLHADIFGFWDEVNAQDKAICERQQIGIASRGYRPSAYARNEDGVHAFDGLVARFYGLARAETTMTGGSLKWMGVVSSSMRDDPYVDYGHVLAQLTPEELRRFVSLAEDPEAYDPSRPAERSYGDETATPLTREQARYLSYRHDVYFPWKVCCTRASSLLTLIRYVFHGYHGGARRTRQGRTRRPLAGSPLAASVMVPYV